MTESPKDARALYGGIVWLVSAGALFIYGIMALNSQSVPGLEELVSLLTSVEGSYIYLSAFVAILIEGLYVIGNFFPGSTLVVLLAILSQTGGIASFLLTILIIFLGWCLSGAVNILLASQYKTRFQKTSHDTLIDVKGRPWTTWHPAFRASYEVAQVAEGGSPMKVLLSSVIVKAQVSTVMVGVTYMIPKYIDIKTLSNKEGFLSVLAVACICLVIGIYKLWKFRTQTLVSRVD